MTKGNNSHVLCLWLFQTINFIFRKQFLCIWCLCAAKELDNVNSMSLTEGLFFKSAAIIRPFGIPPLSESKEHLQYLMTFFWMGFVLWFGSKSIISLLSNGEIFQDCRMTVTLSTCLFRHCRSGKSFVISMVMISTETCEDQDNWSSFWVSGDNK